MLSDGDKEAALKPGNMQIAFRLDGDRPAARYASATTVHEEVLRGTRWLGRYWSASGQVQRENVAARLPALSEREVPLHAFDLEVDGQDLRGGWEHVASSQRPGGRQGTVEGVVELRHLVRPVSVRVVTRLDGTPFLARRLEIANTGKAPAALSRVSPWSGILWSWTRKEYGGEAAPDAAAPFRLGWFDAVMNGHEGNFRWENLPLGWRRIESTIGQSGFGNPYFMVRNEVTGETAIGSIAWSGNWYAEFWRDPFLDLADRPGRGLNLAFRMGPQGPAPLRMIDAGETLSTPETHLAILHAGLDDCVAAWHAHLRASVIPQRPPSKMFHTVAGRVVEEPGEWILREIDTAAQMGIQAFMVDAGWYGGEFADWRERRGDWSVGPWMPGGLAGCRERCRRHGMQFGLWMEPEVMGRGSRLLADHPDWALWKDQDPEAESQALDLARPEAAAFVKDSVLRVIREHRLDFFKLDYNVQVHEGGQGLRGGFLEHEGWRHCEAMYSTLDAVRAAMPDVTLECCSSGGGRNDLGMMARFHYACESDYSQFPRSIRAINGLTLFLPPESLCYYHNHIAAAHQQADLDTHLRVALFARPVFVGFGGQDADRSTPYFEKTRRCIKLANEYCGPILADHPTVFHHTPGIGLTGPASWCVLEYAAKDRGYAGVFRLSGGDDTYVLRLRGAARGAEYEVTMDNAQESFRAGGRELAETGIAVRLDAARTSELILYRRRHGGNGNETGL